MSGKAALSALSKVALPETKVLSRGSNAGDVWADVSVQLVCGATNAPVAERMVYALWGLLCCAVLCVLKAHTVTMARG